MTDKCEPYFDGDHWKRAEVVKAQRSRAVTNARRRGWDVIGRSLIGKPVAAVLVEEFERLYGISLPTDYRSFLLQVGDGGDGPGLYMRPLGSPFNDSLPWAEGEIHNNPNDPNSLLGLPFPHKVTCKIEPGDTDLHTTAGALYLFDHGDALWDLLVVTGSCAGQIWLDRLADSEGLFPASNESGDRMGFAEYYCRWLDGGNV